MAKYFPEEVELEDVRQPVSHPQPSCSSTVAWESQKENIQPLKQGRKIDQLMDALTLLDDNKALKERIKARGEQFEQDLSNESDQSKQLDLWCQYIDWLEQNVPNSGKINGITDAIEKCIEIYHDKKEFKQDERLFDIFMKFKSFCDEPMEVFGFMYANSICSLLANFYINWSWHYEMRKNVDRASKLIKLGLKNLATPREVLEEAEKQLEFRIHRMISNGELDEQEDSQHLNTRDTQSQLHREGIRATLQTLKFNMNDKKRVSKVPINRIGGAVDQTNIGGLKSQTKVVNGVRVPKKAVSRKLNAPIPVLTESTIEDQNDENAVAISLGLSKKIPTSQRIQSVGRLGSENQAPKRGILR